MNRPGEFVIGIDLGATTVKGGVVDRSGAIVQSFRNTAFGYVDFRTSLYGPPPR